MKTSLCRLQICVVKRVKEHSMSTVPCLFWSTSARGSLEVVHSIYCTSRVMPFKRHTCHKKVATWGGDICTWIWSTRTFHVKFTYYERNPRATSAGWPSRCRFTSTRKRVKTWRSGSVAGGEPGQVCRESGYPYRNPRPWEKTAHHAYEIFLRFYSNFYATRVVLTCADLARERLILN